MQPKGLGNVGSLFKPKRSIAEKNRLKKQNKEHAAVIQQPSVELRERGDEDREYFELGLILDCTNSMKPWIDRAKETLNEVIDEVKNQQIGDQELAIRVCFIGYRDHKDDERFSIMPFNDNVEMVKEFMAGVIAEGGKDFPEDVVGGLKMCLMQDWTEEASKKVFFVTDAPCHGKKFSGDLDDHYPEGSPEGLQLEDLMREFCKKEIDFTMIQLNNSVEAMLACMRESHQEMEVQNMSAEFVAAFIDNQPQDIQSMFREADNKRYNELNSITRVAYAPPVGSGIGVTSHPMPPAFNILDDPAFVNKGESKKVVKTEMAKDLAMNTNESLEKLEKLDSCMEESSDYQLASSDFHKKAKKPATGNMFGGLFGGQSQGSSLFGSSSQAAKAPASSLLGGSVPSAPPVRFDFQNVQKKQMSRRADDTEMNRFYGQMSAQSAMVSVQKQQMKRKAKKGLFSKIEESKYE